MSETGPGNGNQQTPAPGQSENETAGSPVASPSTTSAPASHPATSSTAHTTGPTTTTSTQPSTVHTPGTATPPTTAATAGNAPFFGADKPFEFLAEQQERLLGEDASALPVAARVQRAIEAGIASAPERKFPVSPPPSSTGGADAPAHEPRLVQAPRLTRERMEVVRELAQALEGVEQALRKLGREQAAITELTKRIWFFAHGVE